MSLKLTFKFRNAFAAVIDPIIMLEHFTSISLRVVTIQSKAQRFQRAEHPEQSFMRVIQVLNKFLLGI